MNAMKKSSLVYGILLLALSAIAWVRWTAEPELDLEGKFEVLRGETTEIEEITWKSEKDEAVITQREDAAGKHLWVKYTKFEKAKEAADAQTPHQAHPHGPELPIKPEDPTAAQKPAEATPEKAEATPEKAEATPEKAEDPTAEATPEGENTPETDPAETTPEAEPEKPEAEPEKVAKVHEFKAGENGEKLLGGLSPFLAIRRLEDVSDEKLANVGLDNPTDELTITRNGRTHSFEVGGEAYGTRDRYLRDKESGTIYLVDDETLRPLRYARTRLPDRTLTSLDKKDLASVTIEDANGTTLATQQLHKDDQSKATWVRAATPDETDEQLNTWMAKALKLKGTSYSKTDDDLSALSLRLKMTYQDEDGKTETLSVFQAGEEGDWWGTSEHTRGHVKLLRGPTKALAQDVSDLVQP